MFLRVSAFSSEGGGETILRKTLAASLLVSSHLRSLYVTSQSCQRAWGYTYAPNLSLWIVQGSKSALAISYVFELTSLTVVPSPSFIASTQRKHLRILNYMMRSCHRKSQRRRLKRWACVTFFKHPFVPKVFWALLHRRLTLSLLLWFSN